MLNFDSNKHCMHAIRLKCLDCCGGSLREVWNCASTGCPLFRFRPLPPRPPAPRKGEQISFLELREVKRA